MTGPAREKTVLTVAERSAFAAIAIGEADPRAVIALSQALSHVMWPQGKGVQDELGRWARLMWRGFPVTPR